jgi:hypothetical protein
MSFTIKAGYDRLRKQVLNISLKRTELWTHGSIFVQQNIHMAGIQPDRENHIEIVKYDDMHALLLNNAIIYEDKKLFSYTIDLQGFRKLNINDPHLYNVTDLELYDFLKEKYVDYYALKWIKSQRTIN